MALPPLLARDIDRSKLEWRFGMLSIVPAIAWGAVFVIAILPVSDVHCSDNICASVDDMVGSVLLGSALATIAGYLLRRSWVAIIGTIGCGAGFALAARIAQRHPGYAIVETAIFVVLLVTGLVAATRFDRRPKRTRTTAASALRLRDVPAFRPLMLRRLALAILVGIFAAVMVAVTTANEEEARRFERSAPQTSATIVKVIDEATVVVEYRQPPANRFRRATIPNLWETYDEGERVRIFYDPDDPERATLVDEPYDAETPLVFASLLLVAAPAAAAGALLRLRRIRAAVAARHTAVRARVRVLAAGDDEDDGDDDEADDDHQAGPALVLVSPLDDAEPAAGYVAPEAPIGAWEGEAEVRGTIARGSVVVVVIGHTILWPQRRAWTGAALRKHIDGWNREEVEQEAVDAAAEAAMRTRPVEALPDPGWPVVRLLRSLGKAAPLIVEMRRKCLTSAAASIAFTGLGVVAVFTGTPSRVAGVIVAAVSAVALVVAALFGRAVPDADDAADLYRLVLARSEISQAICGAPLFAAFAVEVAASNAVAALAIAGPASLLCIALTAPTRGWLLRMQDHLDGERKGISIQAVVTAPAPETPQKPKRWWRRDRHSNE